jgi:hypothetical protein
MERTCGGTEIPLFPVGGVVAVVVIGDTDELELVVDIIRASDH